MSETNPYAVPQSAVERPQEQVGGSLENALAGNFSWSIGAVLSEAWQKQSGFKATALGAVIVYYIIAVVLSVVLNLVLPGEPGAPSSSFISQLIVMLATYPLLAGLMMMGIKRAAGIPVTVSMLFNYYGKTLPIFLLYVIMSVLILIGMVLLVLPGIYLAIAYTLALPLLVEKNLGVWESLETSRKVITKCWFKFFGLMLVISLIVLVSAIPLGIGLIWTLPMAMIAVGIVYRDVFGVNESIE